MKNLYGKLGLKNILLVDDDPWTLDSLALFFQVEGCKVRSAADATEAMEAGAGERFDLILCEYWLPDMDGLSLLNTLGETQREAIRLLTTAYLTPTMVAEAERSGIHGVIRKPFSVDAMEKTIQRHFSRTGILSMEGLR